MLVPLGAGLRVFLEPVFGRRRQGVGWRRVGPLSAVPDDGIPKRFPIRAPRQDAWTRWPGSQVGAVYLRRTGPTQLHALSVICPHAGCHVHYNPEAKQFICPCHASAFDITGKRLDPAHSPSPRGMDPLKVELREDGQIWVQYVNYRSGVAARIPEV